MLILMPRIKEHYLCPQLLLEIYLIFQNNHMKNYFHEGELVGIIVEGPLIDFQIQNRVVPRDVLLSLIPYALDLDPNQQPDVFQLPNIQKRMRHCHSLVYPLLDEVRMLQYRAKMMMMNLKSECDLCNYHISEKRIKQVTAFLLHIFYLHIITLSNDILISLISKTCNNSRPVSANSDVTVVQGNHPVTTGEGGTDHTGSIQECRTSQEGKKFFVRMNNGTNT